MRQEDTWPLDPEPLVSPGHILGVGRTPARGRPTPFSAEVLQVGERAKDPAQGTRFPEICLTFPRLLFHLLRGDSISRRGRGGRARGGREKTGGGASGRSTQGQRA